MVEYNRRQKHYACGCASHSPTPLTPAGFGLDSYYTTLSQVPAAATSLQNTAAFLKELWQNNVRLMSVCCLARAHLLKHTPNTPQLREYR